MNHALTRTSPKGKGEPFIGRCMCCGQEGLDITALQRECPNPRAMTNAMAIVQAIQGGEA